MKRVDPLHRRARISWNSQRQRCRNPRQECFKDYGAKGIRVEYSFEEFCDWYVKEYTKRAWRRPSVGRIDHSKNYSLDNIEMVEHADNAREMYERTGGNKTVGRTPVVLVGHDAAHAFADNLSAAKFAGVTPSYICLRKRVKADPRKLTKFPYKVYGLDEFLRGEGLPPQESTSIDTPKLHTA